MSDRQLLRVQALSGSVFLLFTLVHLANTAAAAFGVEAYESWLASARAIYQLPFVEIGLLMVPLVVHWTAAVLRLRRDGFSRRNGSLRARLHRYSGWYLMLFIWGHVIATRSPSLIFGIEVDFTTIAFTLDYAWMPYWFLPYYAILALSGLYHGLNGLFLAASIFGVRTPDGVRFGVAFWLPVSAAGALLLLGIAGLAGLLYPTVDPATGAFGQWAIELMGG